MRKSDPVRSESVQEKSAGIAVLIMITFGLLYTGYLFFFASHSPVTKQISASFYQGPINCPKTIDTKIELNAGGCFSPKTILDDGIKYGFRYRSEGYRGSAPDKIIFYRNDNDAVVVVCYTDKFVNTSVTGNGCFIRGIEKDVFVVSESEK